MDVYHLLSVAYENFKKMENTAMHLASKLRMLKRLILMDEGCFFLTQKPPISGSETILEAR